MARMFYDEMHDAGGECRSHYREFARWLADTPEEQLLQRRREADLLFHRAGITFTLYGDEQGTERLIPFDTIPRSIPAAEWAHIEAGCIQRVQALNLFLADLYHEQRILKAGVIPAEQVLANDQYQLAMQGLDLPGNVYAHIAGVDLVRDGSGNYYVLEDNLRTPSGVSYMLENRKMMMRLFPELFVRQRVAPIDHYPDLLLDTLKRASDVESPSVVVLTPGRFNSAYFEHAFLAREMGVELVEGADLFVRDERVYMRTTAGPQPVDVIYRRIDDAFLDPLAFNPDSLLGVPGLLAAYRAGNLVLANAIGTGVADDKSIYPYVPDMIRFYLGEDPLLHNVPTWQCRKPKELAHVLAHLPELVVKETQGSGGYGMLVGPAASREEIELFRERLKARPEAYIAQPTLYGELAAERLLSFFALDPDNPASIYSCLAAARASAHAVRGRITLDMWENINATWLEMRGIAAEGILRYGISRFCEWVKDRSHLFRGATFATSMRNDAFRFIRLGTFIERADNTLRLLDARYQTQGEAALAGADEGTARGYYQWSALLRALSAFEGYTELYRASPNARNIAELLLLREDVPRSLLSCIEELSEILSGLPGVNGRPAQRLAAELEARVRYTGIDEVLEQGLHTWITDYILLVRQLANAIHSSYLEAA